MSRRYHRSWCSDKLSSALEGVVGAETLADASESAKGKRLFDFIISPGKVSMRIQTDGNATARSELLLPPLSETDKTALFEAASTQALIYSFLLANELPEELSALSLVQPLIPEDPSAWTIDCDCRYRERSCWHAAVLVLRLIDRVRADPFTLMQFRGIGREELLNGIRRARSSSQSAQSFDEEYVPVTVTEVPSSVELEKYWKPSKESLLISFSLKADELPAAILKRLDSLPVGENESECDAELERAYEYIARRAQAYALGLTRMPQRERS